jgi:hypothetical protein
MNATQRLDKATANFRLLATEEKNSSDTGRTVLYFIACLAALFCTWGVLCLLFGLSHDGGLCGLVRNWLAAVHGL